MSNAIRLPHLLSHARFVCVPNAWDAASARRAEAAGAAFVATTSAGVAWSLGLRDGQSLLPAQVLQRAVEIHRVCPRSALSIDIERGYSDDPEAVADLVDALVAHGVSGINLEDGADPPTRLATKIRAIRARHGREQLFINARTDVHLAALVDDGQRPAATLERARCYLDAGGDGVFVPGLAGEAAIAELARAIDAPLNVMAVPGLPEPGTLQRLGVRRLSAGPAVAIATYAYCESEARRFIAHGAVSLATGRPGFAEMDSVG